MVHSNFRSDLDEQNNKTRQQVDSIKEVEHTMVVLKNQAQAGREIRIDDNGSATQRLA
jgi:hypothetical protein